MGDAVSGVKGPTHNKMMLLQMWVGLYARLIWWLRDPMIESGDSPRSRPGFSALRRGRVSAVGAEYFLTLTLRRPLAPGRSLAAPDLLERLRHRWIELEAEKHWCVHCAVVMPDHVHLLVTLLGAELAQVVRLFKGPLSPALRTCGLHWQGNYFDHRLRTDDALEPIARYMWLNPYRAGLVDASEVWGGWWCSAEVSMRVDGGASDAPPSEWWR